MARTWFTLILSHKDPKELDVKLGGIIEIYEKFMGDDPRKIPMKIFPAVHYSMGGMWVDYNQMTNIPGLFAAANANTNITARTVWARTRCCRRSTAAWWQVRRLLNTLKA